MALAILQYRIMPKSTETNLKEVESSLVDLCKKLSAILNKVETQEIAFGLKALVATIGWKEEKSQDELEDAIKGIKGVSSLELLDYRRAIG